MAPLISGGGAGGGGAISGVTVTGAAAAGQVPVASSAAAGAWAYPPGFQFGYDQVTTASISVTSVTEAAGTTLITCAAHVFDGSAVWCSFWAPNAATAGTFIVVSLFEGATQISRIVDAAPGASGNFLWGEFKFTPTAASHSYVVTAFRGTANVTLLQDAGGTGGLGPMFVAFTKV